jgi:hypothetical protein
MISLRWPFQGLGHGGECLEGLFGAAIAMDASDRRSDYSDFLELWPTTDIFKQTLNRSAEGGAQLSQVLAFVDEGLALVAPGGSRGWDCLVVDPRRIPEFERQPSEADRAADTHSCGLRVGPGWLPRCDVSCSRRATFG